MLISNHYRQSQLCPSARLSATYILLAACLAGSASRMLDLFDRTSFYKLSPARSAGDSFSPWTYAQCSELTPSFSAVKHEKTLR
eukprot:scaffold5363_cov113-Skeletonema_dohrnii-CCMP3373.AAC.8